MPLESLIAPYGYLAVFFWAPFEGDWGLVPGALGHPPPDADDASYRDFRNLKRGVTTRCWKNNAC